MVQNTNYPVSESGCGHLAASIRNCTRHAMDMLSLGAKCLDQEIAPVWSALDGVFQEIAAATEKNRDRLRSSPSLRSVAVRLRCQTKGVSRSEFPEGNSADELEKIKAGLAFPG